MKKLLTLFFLAAFLSAQLTAQTNSTINARLAAITDVVKNGTDWVKFKTEKRLSPTTVITENKEAFGLSTNDAVQLLRSETDNLGMIHYRYDQYFKNIPVEAGQYIIHAKNGIAISGNGKLATGINVDVTATVSADQAIQYALKYIGAKHYQWEDAGAEQLMKQIQKDPNATFYPKPELVITPTDFSANIPEYRLAYKMNIYAYEPLTGKTIFVDAHSGEVISTLELIQAGDANATAITKYSGTRTIVTDSLAPNSFRLREYDRAGGIQTFNMNTLLTYGTAVDFTDADNYWDNVDPAQDEAATDAHWGAEMTYDYYKQKHGRNSFDNNGSTLFNYVHYYQVYVNAFWNGYWMTYGDGDGVTYHILVATDIEGHEITHGVTQHSAALIYQNESGALNESFSDIFGTCVEFFSKPATANWSMGEDIGMPFRDLSTPKKYACPDTYKGTDWGVGTADYGYVHQNSTVQGHWFYLLSEGGSGTNDIGNTYNVSAIGIDSAALIAYRNLTVYAPKNCRFIDARQGAIWAAEDIFGVCSNAAIQTANAWYAVGLGDPISDGDAGLLKAHVPTGCGLTSAETISVLFRNNGCYAMSAGDTVYTTYRMDKTIIKTDTVVLSTPLAPGDSLNYNFTKKADLSVYGSHTVDLWIRHRGDTLHFNDSLLNVIVQSRMPQNIDLGIVSMVSPVSGCQLSANELVSVRFQFLGCDSLPANEKIAFGYRINKGTIVKDTLVLTKKMLPNDSITFPFRKKADLSAQQVYRFDCWTDYAKDTMHKNDSIINLIITNPFSVINKKIGFEDSVAVIDSFYVVTNPQSKAYVSHTAAKAGGYYGFRMTGGNWINNRYSYRSPTDLNTWTANTDFLSEVCFCVDASSFSKVYMHFDMKQTYNYAFTLLTDIDNHVTSNVRVLVNGTQIGNTYNPKLIKQDQFVTHNINLNNYAGTSFTVCFQAKNFLDEKYDTPPKGMGDNAFLDNIYFTQDSITGIADYTIPTMDFNVYPNPGTDKITLSYYHSSQTEPITIELIDLLGRAVISLDKSVNTGSNSFSIDTGHLAKGIYTIRLHTVDGVGVKKVVIE